MPLPPKKSKTEGKIKLQRSTVSGRLAAVSKLNKSAKALTVGRARSPNKARNRGSNSSQNDELNKLKNILKESRSTNVILQQTNEHLGVTVEDLSALLIRSNEENRKSRQTVVILNEKIEHLRHEVSQASLTQSDLRMKLGVAAEEIQTGSTRLTRSENCLRETRTELANTQQQLSESQQLTQTLNTDVNEERLRVDAMEHHLKAANQLMQEAQDRERAQSSHFLLKVQQAEAAELQGKAAILETEKTRDEVQERCAALEESSKSMVEHYQVKAARIQETADEFQRLAEDLRYKLKQKYSRLEVLDKSISSSVKTLLDNLRESAASEGHTQDALKWRVVRSQVEILQTHMHDVFDNMSANMLEKDIRIESLTQSVDQGTKAIEAQAKSVDIHQDHDVLYKRILRPLAPQKRVPFYGGIVSKGKFARGAVGVHRKPDSTIESNSSSKSTSKTNYKSTIGSNSLSESLDEEGRILTSELGAYRMRGRLLLSATRAEDVAELIERARTWDGTCSTVVMVCCKHCGAFFIERDVAWPSNCPFNEEHQEFVAL